MPSPSGELADPRPAYPDPIHDAGAFHEELRRRNAPNLLWTAVVVNTAYVGWAAFDYILVPEHWRYFLVLRLLAVTVISVVVVAVLRGRRQRYTWEAFWLMAFVYLAFIALMLPLVGDHLLRYVMGYAVTVFGAGLIPVWPPRWEASVLLASIAVAVGAFMGQQISLASSQDLIGSGFFVVTAVTLSLITAAFKYNLARRDFMSRAQLAAVAQRESEARLGLARTSADLKTALEKLQELDRLKSKFFANISHELRTPLTLILAPVEEVSQRVTDGYLRQQMRVVRRNAERLLGLINDLLDLSRLDAGGLRLNLAEMDVRSVAGAVYENSKPAALAKAVEFELTTDQSDRQIWGDAHRLEIVLTNLVSNAIKFTPPGGAIAMRVSDRNGGVRVTVEDSGRGIPAGDLPRVFERFYQVNPADRRREGGVGIGLALAKELVELHGGEITVASEVDRFTRFTVDLPFGRDHIRPEVIERRSEFEARPIQGRRVEDRVAADLASSIDTDNLDDLGDEAEPILFDRSRRARVLLVEDNPEVLDFIRSLIRPHCDLLTAANGREALELLREENADLVVSDVMMPEMSGTELCRAIKSDPKLRATPVILLTARVGSEATLEAYAHGADDFVAKPFHPRVLLARIRAQLKLRALGIQLAQREKMAAVGTLAAGILHEVGNPVNAVLNAARVLAAGTADPVVAKRLIEVIAEGAGRIEGITAALNAHARPAESGVTSSSDVREGLDSTVKLLGHRLDGVVVQRRYASDRMAKAPAGPINQVFLNLIDNAVRAGAGNIWLGVDDAGDCLRVTVGDDGPGVEPKDSERIFDPFYSRRSDGSGTGLGLYLSRQLVEEHGGTLRVEQRGGGGAEFVVELPVLGADRKESSGSIAAGP